MRHARSRALSFALPLPLLLAACGSGDDRPAPARAAAPAPRVVTIAAGEWWFRAPAGLAPGRTVLRLRNDGERTHQLALARLAPGVSLERALETGGSDDTATPLGEVVARPGATGELAAELTPGRYALLCFETHRGRIHAELGQTAQFRVPRR